MTRKPTWWITRDIDARINGVDRAKEYLEGKLHRSIPFEVMEQAIWLATAEAEKGPGVGS